MSGDLIPGDADKVIKAWLLSYIAFLRELLLSYFTQCTMISTKVSELKIVWACAANSTDKSLRQWKILGCVHQVRWRSNTENVRTNP